MVVAGSDDLHLDQPGVEAEPDDVGADCRDDEPHGVDGLSAQEGDYRPCHGTQHGNGPEEQLVPCGDGRAVDDGDRREVRIGADECDVAADFLNQVRRRSGGRSHDCLLHNGLSTILAPRPSMNCAASLMLMCAASLMLICAAPPLMLIRAASPRPRTPIPGSAGCLTAGRRRFRSGRTDRYRRCPERHPDIR